MVATDFIDFTYPGDAQPAGVLDAATDQQVAKAIVDLAAEVGEALDVWPSRRTDCRHACVEWQRVLERVGVRAVLVGGEGVDGEEVGSDYRVTTPATASGYLESDGTVHRHYWLAIGDGGRLFDPTAHQFDDRGGVERGRYRVDGRLLRERNTTR